MAVLERRAPGSPEAHPAPVPERAPSSRGPASREDEELLILANRTAGTLARVRGGSPLEEYARTAGLRARVQYTHSSRQLKQILQQQVVGKRSRVAIAGGDGTVHHAVQVLARTDTTLCILPMGTANNFATALHLPMDMPSAFRVIAEGEERLVELGDAGGEYFTEGAGVGVFADLLALSGAQHNPVNTLRGLSVCASTFLFNQPRELVLEIDGVRREELALNITIANSFCVGYNLPIAPTARLTDGLLDVIILGALTRREMWPYYRAIRGQVHMDLPKITTLRAKEVRITASTPMVVHVDERARRKTPLTTRIVPEALRVMVDRL